MSALKQPKEIAFGAETIEELRAILGPKLNPEMLSRLQAAAAQYQLEARSQVLTETAVKGRRALKKLRANLLLLERQLRPTAELKMALLECQEPLLMEELIRDRRGRLRRRRVESRDYLVLAVDALREDVAFVLNLLSEAPASKRGRPEKAGRVRLATKVAACLAEAEVPVKLSRDGQWARVLQHLIGAAGDFPPDDVFTILRDAGRYTQLIMRVSQQPDITKLPKKRVSKSR